MPPEVHPRRRPAHPLLRIAVAVLSGAAAMQAISAYKAGPARQTAPPASVKPPAAPQPPKPKLEMPTPASRPAPPRPAASSMLVAPEPLSGPSASPHLIGSRLKTNSWNSEFSRVGSQGIHRRFSNVGAVQANPLHSAPLLTTKAQPKLLTQEPLPSEAVPISVETAPEIPLEKPFWTEDRLLRVGGSALVALLGLLYISATAFPHDKAGAPPQ